MRNTEVAALVQRIAKLALESVDEAAASLAKEGRMDPETAREVLKRYSATVAAKCGVGAA